jgi:hypothetical protein
MNYYFYVKKTTHNNEHELASGLQVLELDNEFKRLDKYVIE